MQKLVNADEVLPKKREQLIEKAMKLKALADRGYKGEREIASQMLADMMQKYDITWSDLDDSIEKYFDFPCNDPYERKLLIQVAYMHLGAGHCYNIYDSETDEQKVGFLKVKCRPRDFIEIKLDWEFYFMKFQEELDIFYRAFVEKNWLFPPNELEQDSDVDENKELSEEEVRKIQGMMNGIDAYTRHLGIEEKKDG